MLNVTDHVAITVPPTQVEQHEAVESVAMPGGMDLGIHDGIAGPAEEPCQTGEQVALVEGVNHYLDSLTIAVEACLDDRIVGGGAIVQGTGVPGDLL